MNDVFHSVTLDESKCKGCINCMKRCPTEAIRVRNGRAWINPERCIDCGECIRVCPNHAKRAVVDDFAVLQNYKYTIALPPPSFYGQFGAGVDIGLLLASLRKIGFDDVFEVARAAEIVTHLTRTHLGELRARLDGPVISSACPTVLRLIRVRFPTLCPNILPVKEPVQLAAKMARDEAVKKTGLRPEEIGVFFLTPCPAKVTAAKSPIGFQHSEIDGCLSVSRVCMQMLPAIKALQNTPTEDPASGRIGVSWAVSGGESSALLTDKRIAADGIENVIKVLEEIEDGKLDDIDFAELNACPGGCVGGVLNMENPFVANSRIRTLRRFLPVTRNKPREQDRGFLQLEKTLEYETVFQLDDDLGEAMEKMKLLNAIADRLPGLDCGGCGAPSCRALAEDIVRGAAKESDCIIRILEKTRPRNLRTGAPYIPIPFRRKESQEAPDDQP